MAEWRYDDRYSDRGRPGAGVPPPGPEPANKRRREYEYPGGGMGDRDRAVYGGSGMNGRDRMGGGGSGGMGAGTGLGPYGLPDDRSRAPLGSGMGGLGGAPPPLPIMSLHDDPLLGTSMIGLPTRGPPPMSALDLPPMGGMPPPGRLGAPMGGGGPMGGPGPDLPPMDGGGQLLPGDASPTLYIDNLPEDCSRREASHIFRPFIGFKEVRLVNKEVRRGTGSEKVLLCFVDFADARCAATAMEALQGYRFDESDYSSPSLRIDFARAGPRSTFGRGPPPPDSYRGSRSGGGGGGGSDRGGRSGASGGPPGGSDRRR